MDSVLIAIITAAAKTAGVPASLLIAICTHESNGLNVMVPHDGGSPSYGYCQIKKETAEWLGYKGIGSGKLRRSKRFHGAMEPVGKPKGLMVAEVNALYAAKYLRKQLDKYDGEWCKATAAYNAGSYLPSKLAPGEPRNLKYVKKVVLHLPGDERDLLICGPRAVQTE